MSKIFITSFHHKIPQQNVHLLYNFALLLLLVAVRHSVDGSIMVGTLFTAHHGVHHPGGKQVHSLMSRKPPNKNKEEKVINSRSNTH
jgi:hypothetical protein